MYLPHKKEIYLMNKKNILVGQSGGPTAVINGSLYGVSAKVRATAMQLAASTV